MNKFRALSDHRRNGVIIGKFCLVDENCIRERSHYNMYTCLLISQLNEINLCVIYGVYEVHVNRGSTPRGACLALTGPRKFLPGGHRPMPREVGQGHRLISTGFALLILRGDSSRSPRKARLQDRLGGLDHKLVQCAG